MKRSPSSKTIRIADALEEYLGKPAQPRRLSNSLDSLIATLLSQNTNDRNSHQAWLNLKKKYSSWGKVVSAPARQLAKVIEVGGLKNQKAARMKEILQRIKKDTGTYDLGFLKKQTNDEVIEYLTSMKGVGMKTAACVLVFSFGRDVFPVDTHIHRLCNRMGLVKTKNADQTFAEMKFLVPKGRAYSFHINLIRFGRKICKAQNPLCGMCPIYDVCSFKEKDFYASRNVASSKRTKQDIDFMILDNVE
ncbi:MAG: endonuclease III [Ignavibacteriales bacterium]|nr:endonuclease III [Ignavibacteriales bacterium]